MNFPKFNSSFLTLLMIFVTKYAGCYGLFSNCSAMVISNGIKYRGCIAKVKTNSLLEPQTPKKTIFYFKGIPYAEPPIGPLRFGKPVPKVLKKGTLVDSRSYKSTCISPVPSDPLKGMSEDCLYLNIWTPSRRKLSNLAVMVWIHGGALTAGASNQLVYLQPQLKNLYASELLALRDVVVITLNYRLGVFGFLYCNTSDCPGNQGLWDQAMAITWVKDNIRNFGGNPNDITLFGESAGSWSISSLIVSKVTRNLFQKAIMMSGSTYCKICCRDVDYAYGRAREFASNAGLFAKSSCPNDHDWIQCLRKKTTFQLLTAQTKLGFHLSATPWYAIYLSPFKSVYGDEFMPISAVEAVREGDFKKDIKILMGHIEMEGALFALLFDVVRGLLGRYVPQLPWAPIITRRIAYNDIQSHFIDNDTIGTEIAERFTEGFRKGILRLDGKSIRRSAVHALGDYYLTCPTILFGGHIVKNKDFEGKVYQYRFTYKPRYSLTRLSVWADATHGDELALVFGKPFSDKLLWSSADRKISREMMDIWTHFAKKGPPKVNGNIWPTYELTADNKINASYIELHASSDRLGKVWTNRYRMNSEEKPPVINNCLEFWDKIITQQFTNLYDEDWTDQDQDQDQDQD